MLLAPYGTDAPLYHYPIAMIGLITANVTVFIAMVVMWATGADLDWLLGLTINFDQINPLQWLTGSFMHLDLEHLISNMLFLFCFGLVVEGKLGTTRFLGLYLVSCLFVGAATQIPMYFIGVGEVEYALGASGAICTLMMIAFIWAPENEIRIFYWVLLFFGTFEVSITVICIFFIAKDALMLTLSGFEISGATAHLIGAALGVPMAIYFLRTGKIDCEGWDLISRNEWLKRYPLLYGENQRSRDEDDYNEVENPVGAALAMAGGDVSKSKVLGTIASKGKPKSGVTGEPSNAVPRGQVIRRKKKASAPSPAMVAKKCQSHPEFNRLSFVLRQSLDAGNLPAAQQAFLRLDALKLCPGIGENTLMRFAAGLAQDKQWVNSIRPLAITIEQRGALADDACLRLAQVQIRVLKRKDLAEITLKKIVVVEGVHVDESKRLRIQKRDEILNSIGIATSEISINAS